MKEVLRKVPIRGSKKEISSKKDLRLEFVENEEKYYDFIRNLRNANHNQGFVENVQITPEQQNDYMKKHKHDYYLCLDQGAPVGFIGSVGGDIRLAVTPAYFRKGVAQFMVEQLMIRHPKATAKVAIHNKASLKLFEKMGFEKKFFLLERSLESFSV